MLGGVFHPSSPPEALILGGSLQSLPEDQRPDPGHFNTRPSYAETPETRIGSFANFANLQTLSVPWFVLLSKKETKNPKNLTDLLPNSMVSLLLDHHSPHHFRSRNEGAFLIRSVAHFAGMKAKLGPQQPKFKYLSKVTLRGQCGFEERFSSWKAVKDYCANQDIVVVEEVKEEAVEAADFSRY